MTDLLYFILYYILRVLLIAGLAISVPLIVLYMSKRYYLNKALKMGADLSLRLRMHLSDSNNCRQADFEERLGYARNSLLTGLGIYLLIIGISFVRTYIDEGRFYIDDVYIFVAVVIGVFVLLFIIKDLMIISPWVTVYRIKAFKCFSVAGKNSADYICYYDFMKKELAAGCINASGLFGMGNQDEKLYDVLAVAKGNKLKVIGRVKD